MASYRKACFLDKGLKLLDRGEQDYIESLTRSLLLVQNSAGVVVEKKVLCHMPREKKMISKYSLLLLVFLAIGTAVYAESFTLLGNHVDYAFVENASGQGRAYVNKILRLLDDRRIRYTDVTFQESNEMYIREIVRRHTIRKGDIYFFVTYFSYSDSTKFGFVEFTSDAQYTYWFYSYLGILQ